MRSISRRLLLAAFACFLSAGAALAQSVGVAASVTQGAFVQVDGTLERLAPRQAISTGDVILTDATGTVELSFRDRTRIVVGPNTRFEIDEVALNANGTARRFSVSLLGGVFRFLSGDSPKRSYELHTPTATMGIRGTVFDVAVDSRNTTRLVTFEGNVRFCGRGRRCAVVTGGCAMVQANRWGRVRPPEDKTERDAAINTVFPFVTNQRGLGGRYRARTESCGDVDPFVVLSTPPAASPLERVTRTQRQRQSGNDRARPERTREDSGGGGGGGPGKDEPS